MASIQGNKKIYSKKDAIRTVSSITGYPQYQVKEILYAFFDYAKQIIFNLDSMYWDSFGTFRVKILPPKVTKSPFSGFTVYKDKRYHPQMRWSKKLIEQMHKIPVVEPDKDKKENDEMELPY